MNDTLTDKQEGFAQDVARGETYADAYRNNYATDGWKIESIWVNSSKLMAYAKVAQRVSELKQKAIERNEVTLDKVIEELSNWLMFDPLDIVDPETDCVKRLADMDKRVRMSLAEIHVSEMWGTEENFDGKKVRTKIGELKKIKFVDKRATAEMFMKKFGAYINEKDNLSDNLDAIKKIIEAAKR